MFEFSSLPFGALEYLGCVRVVQVDRDVQDAHYSSLLGFLGGRARARGLIEMFKMFEIACFLGGARAGGPVRDVQDVGKVGEVRTSRYLSRSRARLDRDVQDDRDCMFFWGARART